MEEKKVVVLGGSFNPPTLAHAELLMSAVNTLNAEYGVFVPSSDNYVKRKMSRLKEYNQVYSEHERSAMLLDLCCAFPRFRVSEVEYGDDGKGHTYQTLKKIQNEYPGYEVIFLLGADKLGILPRWHNHDNLLSEFSFGVAARGTDEDGIWEAISGDNKLNRFKSKFYVIPMVGDMSDVSSSKARELILKGSFAALEGVLSEGAIDYLLSV